MNSARRNIWLSYSALDPVVSHLARLNGRGIEPTSRARRHTGRFRRRAWLYIARLRSSSSGEVRRSPDEGGSVRTASQNAQVPAGAHRHVRWHSAHSYQKIAGH